MIPDLDITHRIGDLEISEQLVKEQLNSLKTSKSPGTEKIHPKLLSELRDFLTQILTKNIFTNLGTKQSHLKTGNLLTLPLSSKKE